MKKVSYCSSRLENIEINSQISIKEFKSFVLQGKVMLPAVQTAMMASNYLVQNGFLDPNESL